MSFAIDYIINPYKTDHKLLITRHNCTPETASLEFELTRNFAHKGKNLGCHLIQSFAFDEIKDPAFAHNIGLELAKNTFGKFQTNIIFNSVSSENYKHYESNYQTYYNIRNVSDKLCKLNGLSVIQNPKKSYATKDKNKKRAEAQNFKNTNHLIANDIKSAIYISNSTDDVFEILKSKGYKIKQGKDITIQHPNADRGRRLATLSKHLHEDLTLNGIEYLINLKDTKPKTRFKLFGYKYKNVRVVLANKIKFSYNALSYQDKKENLQLTLNALAIAQKDHISSYKDLNTRLSLMNRDIKTFGAQLQIIDGKLNHLSQIFALANKYQNLKSKLLNDPKNKVHIKVMKAIIKDLEEYGIKNLSSALNTKNDIQELKNGRISLASDFQTLLY